MPSLLFAVAFLLSFCDTWFEYLVYFHYMLRKKERHHFFLVTLGCISDLKIKYTNKPVKFYIIKKSQ